MFTSSMSTFSRSTFSESSAPTRVLSGALDPARISISWSTVLPLALVMAFADGFWLTALTGAVGAIERSQTPFASWWQASTLMVPVFVFAVLAALTLALRWFGPLVRTPRAVLATVLLIVAAGTLVGLAAMVASSAYDYQLQSDQLHLMNSMQGLCTGNCLEQQKSATLAIHVRAVLYVSRWLVLSNLVLVAWIVAMRGGRVKAGITARRPTTGRRRTRSRVGDIQLLLAAALIASAAIHTGVVHEHFAEWTAAGVFFIFLAAAEIATATAVLLRPPRRVVLLAGVAISVLPLLLWLYSRTAGMPFGPAAAKPDDIGGPDVIACLLEVGSLVAAVLLLRPMGWLRRRPPASAHTRGLTLLALTAITAIGLAAIGPSWFDILAVPGDQSHVIMSR